MMTVAAIAAEYNPFHNGHAYQIAQTRAAGATHVAAVMSGNFTQRGTAALAEKRARIRSALTGGVDLVVELPLPYAMATAQRFALGAVSIAEGMGCVDVLSFGSESGYLSILQAAAEAVDSPAVVARQSELLGTGVTFARARQQAVSELCGDEVADMLSSPNDNLAVEYIRQLRRIKSRIAPFAVTRIGARHDEKEASGEIASASFLRSLIRSGGVDQVRGLIPPQALAALREALEEGEGVFREEALRPVIFGVLRRMDPASLSRLPDLSEGLENRIYAAIRQAERLDEVYSLAKSKRYTAARIRRTVTAAFLGMEDGYGASDTGAPYIRVLGFNERGREILARMKQTARLPVSDSLAYLRRLGGRAEAFAELEARSSDLYRLGLPKVGPCGWDYTAPSVRNI